MQKFGQSSAAPIEYIEMLILPARGWAYSETQRLTLIERHLLYAMLAIEADPMYQPDKT